MQQPAFVAAYRITILGNDMDGKIGAGCYPVVDFGPSNLGKVARDSLRRWRKI